MADIFISYAKADQKAVKAVAAAFQAHGWSVWYDDRLQAGESWDEVIERELTAARCVVVLWSDASVKSKWVRNESRRGGDKLVPATLSAVKLPIEFEHVQAAHLAGWNGDPADAVFQKLVGGVVRILDHPPKKVTQTWVSKTLRSRRLRMFSLATLFVAVAAWFAYKQPWSQQTVLLMDSPLPNVVYDKDAAAKGQTNATVIADILKELPVIVTKESTDLEWHRESDIRRMRPSLIIIHGSAFYSETNGSDNAGKLLSFLESMKDSNSRFLIYTRVSTDALESELQKRIPGWKTRFRFWQVPGGRNANFNDPATRRMLIQIVKEVLST
jgi:TIR domain